MLDIRQKVTKLKYFHEFLVIILAIICVIVVNFLSSAIKIDENDFAFDGQFTYVEKNQTFNSYTELTIKANETATLVNTIKDEYIVDKTLVIRTNFLFVNVYADNQLIYSYTEETSDLIFPDYAKSKYHYIELPTAQEELEISIEFIASDLFSNYEIRELYVGYEGEINYAIVKSLILYYILIVLNMIIVMVVICLFLNYYHKPYKMKKNLIVTTILTVVWACSDRGLGQLLHDNYLVDFYLAIVTIFVLHFFFMIRLLPMYKNNKVYKGVLILQVCFLMTVLITHFSGIMPMEYWLKYNYANYFILLGFFVYYYFVMQKGKKEYSVFRYAILMIITVLIVELLFLHYSPSNYSSSLILLFVLVYNILHIIDYFKFIIAQERDNELLKLQLSDAQTKVLITEIKPHFLYNALNSIRALCSIDVELAKETINNLAKYFRSNTNSLNSLAPILFDRELEHIRSYINIEKVRFGDRVKFIEELETVNFYVPSLSIEPLVENAVAHGLSKKKKGGEIKLRTYEDKKNFYVEVVDNGVGFDVNVDKNPSSIGLNNSKQRLQIFSNGILEIHSEIGKGTKILVTLPKVSNQ